MDVTPSRYMDELPAEHVRSYERDDEKELSFEELSALAREFLDKQRRGTASTS